MGDHYIDITSTNGGRSGRKIKTHRPVPLPVTTPLYCIAITIHDLEARGMYHGFKVETIVYNGGHRFPPGAPSREELLPYKLITFNQR